MFKLNPTAFSNFRLILNREYKARIRKKSFMINITLTSLILFILLYVPITIAAFNQKTTPKTTLSDSVSNDLIPPTPQTKIAIINKSNLTSLSGQNLSEAFEKWFNAPSLNQDNPTDSETKPPYLFSFPAPDEVESALQQLRDEKLDFVLVIENSPDDEPAYKLYYTYASNYGANMFDNLNSLALSYRFYQAGFTEIGENRRLLTLPRIDYISAERTTLQEDNSGNNLSKRTQENANRIMVYALNIVLFSFIATYGMVVAIGVAEEKSSRVMEIILSAVTPNQLLFGKIIGIGLVALTELSIIASVVVVAILLQEPISWAVIHRSSPIIPFLTGIKFDMLGFFVLFFLLGYCLYATLNAAAGSLCSRIEDVPQARAPLNYLQSACYLVTVSSIPLIDTPVVTVLSYVPFFSPVLMFARVSAGKTSFLEIIIMLLILSLTIFLCTLYAARIYRVGILLYGKRPGIWKVLGFTRVSKSSH